VRERLKVLFVTGGDSLERRSSPGSASHVMAVLAPGWCDAYLVALEAGPWRLPQGAGLSSAERATARFDGCDLTLKSQVVALRFDVVFMAIHGAPAETGNLQALLEWPGLPYVGSGVLTSALAMDKTICKRSDAGQGERAGRWHRSAAGTTGLLLRKGPPGSAVLNDSCRCKRHEWPVCCHFKKQEYVSLACLRRKKLKTYRQNRFFAS
jgi:hypothetical protein